MIASTSRCGAGRIVDRVLAVPMADRADLVDQVAEPRIGVLVDSTGKADADLGAVVAAQERPVLDEGTFTRVWRRRSPCTFRHPAADDNQVETARTWSLIRNWSSSRRIAVYFRVAVGGVKSAATGQRIASQRPAKPVRSLSAKETSRARELDRPPVLPVPLGASVQRPHRAACR